MQHDRHVSFFEFWPSWVMYTPVAAQWLWHSIKYRSLTLPLIANPRLPLSAMVGAGKSELFEQATGDLAAHILDWRLIERDDRAALHQAQDCWHRLGELGLPFVAKPDVGCRGVGVHKIESFEQFVDYLSHYPAGARVIAQRLADHAAEVGIFYVKKPEDAHGRISSMTFKQSPQVTGNGIATLGELVAQDPRAGQLLHLYQSRHAERWHEVIPSGEAVALVFSASHSKGAVFSDARREITPALEAKIDALMSDLPDFHYGRLDVKYRDLAALQRGETLQIVEINGASAESIFIWDKHTTLGEALKTLLWQYRTLFEIGEHQRRRGFVTPGVVSFWRALRREKSLSRLYPETQ